MKKSNLYVGDSSEEELVTYSRKQIIKKASVITNEKPWSLSSFILIETSQSILEHTPVRAAYRYEKRSLAKKNFVIQNLRDDIYISPKLFGQYLVDKHTGLENFQELKAFYAANLKKIQEFKKSKIDIFRNLKFLKQAFTKCEIKDLDFTEAKNFFSQYFLDNAMESIVKLYFIEDDFNKITNSIIQGKVSELTFSKLGALAFYTASKQPVQKVVEDFFHKKFCDICFNKLLDRLRGNDYNFRKFLAHISQTADHDLIDVYAKYPHELLGILSNKKSKTVEREQVPMKSENALNFKQDLTTRFYIDYLNLAHNKPINDSIVQLRSDKLFDGNPTNFFARFKLDHKIMMGAIKGSGIGRYDNTLVHNRAIGELSQEGVHEYQTDERNTIYGTGARADLVFFNRNETSYEQIGQEILTWNIPASKIVEQIQTIFKNGNTYVVNNKQRETLYKLMHLLFCIEPERNTGAFLTNAMFFELAKGEKYSINDLHIKLPMAIRKDKNNKFGAVPAVRHIMEVLGGKYGKTSTYLTKRHHYDFGQGDEEKALELALRDTLIFIDWLSLNNVLIKDAKVIYSKKSYKRNTEALTQVTVPLAEIYNEFIFLQNSGQKYQQGNIANLISSANQYVFKLFVANSDLIFKKLHALIQDWYGITLDYLIADSPQGPEKGPPTLSEEIMAEVEAKESSPKISAQKPSKLLTIEPSAVTEALKTLVAVVADELNLKDAKHDDWDKGWYTDAMQQLLLRSYNPGALVHEKINTATISKTSELIAQFTKLALFEHVSGSLEGKIAAIKGILQNNYGFLTIKDIKDIDKTRFDNIGSEEIKQIEQIVNSITLNQTISKYETPLFIISKDDTSKYELIYRLKNTIYGSLKDQDTGLSPEINKFLKSDKSHLVLPININNNHWTAFVINKDKKIIYIDTLEKKIIAGSDLELVLEEIQKSLGTTDRPHYLFPKQVQYDGYNCGPFMIEAVSRIICNQGLEDFKEISDGDGSEALGKAIRAVHKNLLNNPDLLVAINYIQSIKLPQETPAKPTHKTTELEDEVIDLIKSHKLSDAALKAIIEESAKPEKYCEIPSKSQDDNNLGTNQNSQIIQDVTMAGVLPDSGV
jgi:Ulp1 protease family, C-terminal catalytic domain